MCLDVAGNDLARLSIHGHSARHKNKAIRLYGLAVDAGQGLGSLVGHDGGLLGHCRWGRDRVCYSVGRDLVIIGGWL